MPSDLDKPLLCESCPGLPSLIRQMTIGLGLWPVNALPLILILLFSQESTSLNSVPQ